MKLRDRLVGRVRPLYFLFLSGAAALLAPSVCLAQATNFNMNVVAGTSGTANFLGDGSAATSADLNAPVAVTVDSSGNLYIADAGNQRVRKVTASTGKISTVAGNGAAAYVGDGGAATAASLSDPYGLAVDKSGNLYIADFNNQVVRIVNSSGTISTFAGINAYGSGGDGGPANQAYLNHPIALIMDAAGDLYISDSGNACIREVTPDGIIHTVAGSITNAGYSGDGGPALQAKLNSPEGIALDAAGNLYIADTGNNRIRMVTPTGIMTTIAGNGKAASSGDGGAATSASLWEPQGVAVDAAGAIFITEKFGTHVREVVNGVINSISSSGGVDEPFGLFVTSPDNVYVADVANDVVRELTPTGPSVAGVISAGAFGAFNAAAPGSWIEIYGTNMAFSNRFWTSADFNGSTAPTALDGTKVTIGGQAAPVYYISGGQVNVQVPTSVSTGTQQLVVQNAIGSSSNFGITINSTEPGLLTQYKANGVQYVSALFQDNKTYAMPAGAVSGVLSQPAKAGDILTLYGIGFGPVTDNVSSGQIAPNKDSTVSTVQIAISGTQAPVGYAGLSPGAVGLYQFNITVPTVTAGNALPVTFTLGGTAGTQTLYIAVQ